MYSPPPPPPPKKKSYDFLKVVIIIPTYTYIVTDSFPICSSTHKMTKISIFKLYDWRGGGGVASLFRGFYNNMLWLLSIIPKVFWVMYKNYESILPYVLHYYVGCHLIFILSPLVLYIWANGLKNACWVDSPCTAMGIFAKYMGWGL